MKVAVVFILLFATVLCRPVRKVSINSSESSEEVVRRPDARKQAALVSQTNAAPVQAAASASDESKGSSEEGAAVAPAAQDKSSSPDPTPTSDTTDSQDSEDDDDDDETEEAESEEEEDESSDSSESGESSTPAPATVSPTVVTEEPVFETTEDPFLPTIVTDPETARGDNLGGYPSEYKSIIYVEDKSYHKVPSPYKSWEYVNTGKKMAYDMTDGNEVEKSLPVFKALQVHSDILEEDTSTPEMESQGLDASQDQEITARRSSLPGEEGESTSDATTSDSSSATQEEEDDTTSASSDSTSTESEDEENSEEATATPGAADSDSDESTESDSDEEGAGPDATTDMPTVITAK